MDKWIIKVPGSTANLGPGFDSIGLAVDRYLTLEVTLSNQWCFTYTSPEYQNLPKDEENLIYKAVEYTANIKGVIEPIPACDILIDSQLPLARGLGSSAAAVVAGIELANVLLNLSLTIEEKLRIGSLYEGHPDNIGASLYGGLTIASHLDDDETFLVPSGQPKLTLAIMVPPNQLLTTLSRNVLPNGLPFKDAVKASSIANVMVASLLQGDYKTAGKMMSKDLFHEPYRSALIPDLDRIKTFVKEKDDVYGAALSGGGPSLMVYLKPENSEGLVKKFKKVFPSYDIDLLEVEGEGSTVKLVSYVD